MKTRRTLKAVLLCAGTLIVATAGATPAFAAAPKGCYYGVWMLNKQLSPPVTVGPMVFIAPWSNDGWVRVSANEQPGRMSGEYQFVAFDGKVYTIHGTDPREVYINRVDDYKLAQTVEGEPDSTNLIGFSQDCKRMTSTSVKENQTIVYDKVLPRGSDGPAAADSPFFGSWMMNQQASKLARPLKKDETLILGPWGRAGLFYISISGGFQPADVKKGMPPPFLDRRRVRRPDAAKLAPNPPNYDWTVQRITYYANWDGTPAYSFGYDPGQIALKRIDDKHFEMDFTRVHQPWLQGAKATLVLSDDGRRITQTWNGVDETGASYTNDVRVYDKVDPSNWPGKTSAFPPYKQ